MLVAKYKFDKSIYENFIPVFNDGYEGYTYTDEIDSENENYVIRTIECDVLPTMMKFGSEENDNATDKSLSLLEIIELNTSGLTSCRRMFKNCRNLINVNTENWTLDNVTDMHTMFYYCTKLTSLDVSNFNTSNVKNMHNTFGFCSELTSLDVSNWNTNNVTSMYAMFSNCNSLTSLDVSNFDTSNVTTMHSMFSGCNKLTSIDLSNFNTSNVTSMSYMFYECNSLTSLDVSNFDTKNVTNMISMFTYCTNLTSIDVSNWDTSEVNNMSYMFYGCTNLTTLDVSNWSINNTDMQSVFHSCTKLHTLDLSNWTSISNGSYIFYNCPSLVYIKCNNIDLINSILDNTKDSNFPNRTGKSIGKIITTSSTNVDTTTLSSLNWSIDTSSGTKLAEYKYDKSIWNSLVPEFNEGYSGYFCNDVIEDEVNSPNVVTRELVGYGGLPTQIRLGGKHLGGSIFTTYQNCLIEVLYLNIGTHITNMNGLFYHCEKLISVNTNNWDTSNVTDMSTVCENCRLLASLDVSNFNTSNVTNMFSIFNNCNNLTSLDVSNFNTNKVTTMGYMFNGCNNLTSLDVSNFNTSNVIYIDCMFHSCKNLTSLDLSNFDTSKVTDMNSMFFNCTNLTSLDVSNFNTNKVTNMSYMFHGCANLTSLDVSNFNTSKVTTMYGMFYNCANLTSLDVSNWDTKNVTSMYGMFNYCNNLTSLDISNFNTSNVTSMGSMFANTPKLSDIGTLYCSQDTINKVIPLITDGSKTIWVQDTKASDYTATDYVTFKDYKEDNRTLYLNSPLLEGDEIVNKEGKLYHYHKMGKVVLDGSKILFTVIGEAYQPTNTNFINFHYLNNNIKIRGEVYSDNFKHVFFGVSSDANTNCIWTHSSNNSIILCINKSKLSTTDANGLKQWFLENPTTIIYELAEPYYELISDDPLIVQSYAEGKLDTSSIITPTSIKFIPYEEELTYLYTSTQYCIQFNSTANCTVDITLGGTKVESKSVSVGLNKIYITTPSTLVDNKLIINAKGNATISEVVVVNSNAEFDYFDGLKSSFEDCLVTDVDSENYGKYEVGVKIVGKNKFKGWEEKIYMKSNTRYSILSDVTTGATRYNIRFYNKNNENITKKISIKNISAQSNLYYNTGGYFRTGADSTYIRNIFIIYGNFEYAKFYYDGTPYLNVRLEEISSVNIPYEPYKETNVTIHLNSPLLKGDRIEVKDGKLCHYHKMRSIVLNGSENEEWNYFDIASSKPSSNNEQYYCKVPSANTIINATTVNCINDRFPSCALDDRMKNITCGFACSNNNFSIIVEKGKYYNSISDVKQWLSENPTTIIYKLSKPYYEDITPIQSSFVISTVSEGDMEIITDLPIKSNITYLTNIASAVLMEQQLDELDNSTESLTNIVEDEINE